MRFRFELAALPLLATAVLSAALAAYAWRKRPASASTPLALMMAFVAEWSLFAGLEALTVDLGTRLVFSKIEYIGTNLTPVFLLLLAVEYSRPDRQHRAASTALMFILPAVHIVMAATNEWHNMVWSGFSPGEPGTNLLVYHHGPWYWVMLATIYAYIVAAGIELVHTAQQARLAARQTAALLAGMLPPMIAGIAYSMGYTPLRGMDFTPTSMFFSGLILAMVFRRLRLLDLVPVPRETLIESMPDAVLVLDPQGTIVDHNPAAREVVADALGKPGQVVGQSIRLLARKWPNWIDVYNARQSARCEIATRSATRTKYMEIHNSPLFDRRGELRGHVTLMRDVSERALAIMALQQSEDRFRLLAETLSFPLVLTRLDEHTVIYANPVAERLLGKPGTSLRGSHLFAEALPQQERLKLWREIGGTRSLRDYELMLRSTSGSDHWMTISTSVARFGDEDVLIISMADITQRKHAEQEREQLIAQLKDALASIKTLSGLVPICASCKKIRDDQGYWHAVEMYVSRHSDAQFTHGLCPDCERALREQYWAAKHRTPENSGACPST